MDPSKSPVAKKPKVIIKMADGTSTAPKSKAARPARQAKEDTNTSEFFSNPNEALGNANIRDIILGLQSSGVWDTFTAEEKKQVTDLWPDQSEILDAGTDKVRLDTDKLRNNNDFRYDIEAYKANIRNGSLDFQYLSEAQNAHSKRMAGDYAEFMADRYKQKWDIEMPGGVAPAQAATAAADTTATAGAADAIEGMKDRFEELSTTEGDGGEACQGEIKGKGKEAAVTKQVETEAEGTAEATTTDAPMADAPATTDTITDQVSADAPTEVTTK